MGKVSRQISDTYRSSTVAPLSIDPSPPLVDPPRPPVELRGVAGEPPYRPSLNSSPLRTPWCPKLLAWPGEMGDEEEKEVKVGALGHIFPHRWKQFFRAHTCVNTTQTIFWGERLFVWNEDDHQVRSVVFHPHRSLPDLPHPALADSQKPASYCCAMQVLSPLSSSCWSRRSLHGHYQIQTSHSNFLW